MSDPYGTEPMFDIPDRYRPPKRQQAKLVWRKHTGKQTSCDRCILALAAGDVKFAPSPAAYVRSTPESRSYLCQQHASAIKEEDRRRLGWSE